MKLLDLAGPTVTTWIVALATIGALSFVPSQPSGEVAKRVARPPLADVNVAAPAMRDALRDAGSSGVDDLLPLDYDRGEDDRYGHPLDAPPAPGT